MHITATIKKVDENNLYTCILRCGSNSYIAHGSTHLEAMNNAFNHYYFLNN